jgi:hypothetical protein
VTIDRFRFLQPERTRNRLFRDRNGAKTSEFLRTTPFRRGKVRKGRPLYYSTTLPMLRYTTGWQVAIHYTDLLRAATSREALEVCGVQVCELWLTSPRRRRAKTSPSFLPPLQSSVARCSFREQRFYSVTPLARHTSTVLYRNDEWSRPSCLARCSFRRIEKLVVAGAWMRGFIGKFLYQRAGIHSASAPPRNMLWAPNRIHFF